MGLHIVFNLVTQSLGGAISVESAEGEGTTFLIRIPRVAPIKPERPSKKETSEIRAKSEVVSTAVLEDELDSRN
ncbi:hypothetical protein CCP2SC5_120040 [Azospirillaceae bacterium]